MKTLVVYHNPACTNFRRALELLRDRGVEFQVVEYLKNPPDRAALEVLVANLEQPAAQLVRKDKRFETLGLKASDYVEPEKAIALLAQHPELMQRPVVVCGNRAIIARPPEKLSALL